MHSRAVVYIAQKLGEVRMRLNDLRRSGNIEDRRGMGGRPFALGGGGLIIVLLLSWLFGKAVNGHVGSDQERTQLLLDR